MFHNKREKCQIEQEVNHLLDDARHLAEGDLRVDHLKDVDLNLQDVNHRDVRILLSDADLLLLDVCVGLRPKGEGDLRVGLQDVDFYKFFNSVCLKKIF